MSVLALLLGSAPGWAAGAQSAADDQGKADTGGAVPTVVVSGEQAKPLTGKAEDGYRQSTVNLGPLGERSLVDTPYSVYTVPSELIKNYNVETFTDLAKFIPSLLQQGHPGLEFGPPVVRGLQADDASANTRIDGFNVRGDTTLPIELYERLEVLTGPSGALYGFSYPAGTLNGILKRPTDEPFEEFSAGYSGNLGYTLRGDAGGHVDAEHRFGYRVNLLHADGEGYVRGSNLNRELASLAVDLKPTDTTTIEANISRYYFDQKGYPGGFAYGGAIGLPSTPDPAKAGYGQSFGGIVAQTDLYEAKIKHDFSKDWHITAGVMRQVADRWFENRITNTLTDNNGRYKTTYSTSGSESFVTSNLANLNGTFYTGPVKHELVLGTNGFNHDAYSMPATITSAASLLGYGTMASPVSYDEPRWWNQGPRYKASNTLQQSLVQVDTVTFNDQWSILAGVSESWLNVHNYSTTGATTSSYRKSAALSPTAALMFKPRQDMTLYVSYASSVQQGDTAGTGTTNAGQVLAPYRSEQYEVGYKAALTNLDLSLATFYIKRPFAAVDASDNTFKEMGNQSDLGVELSAKGKLTPDLTVFGGVTWLDTKMADLAGSAYAGNDGNQVVGVPQWQANLLTEYTLPVLRQLTASLNLHYTGRRAANAENSSWADGYVTTDLGIRYQDEIKGHPVTWKASVENVFDEHYWLSINGNMNGQPGATNTAYLGAPRTFKTSLTVKF